MPRSYLYLLRRRVKDQQRATRRPTVRLIAGPLRFQRRFVATDRSANPRVLSKPARLFRRVTDPFEALDARSADATEKSKSAAQRAAGNSRRLEPGTNAGHGFRRRASTSKRDVPRAFFLDWKRCVLGPISSARSMLTLWVGVNPTFLVVSFGGHSIGAPPPARHAVTSPRASSASAARPALARARAPSARPHAALVLLGRGVPSFVGVFFAAASRRWDPPPRLIYPRDGR